MKSTYLVLCLLLFTIIVTGQEIGKDAVVAPVKMNILYRGMANPVEIAVPGVTSDKVTATVSNGTIKKVNSWWEVSPGDQDASVITVLVNNKKVSEKVFRIKNVPQPEAVFDGKSVGETTKERALRTEELKAELKDFAWDLKFTITGFVFLCSDGKNDFEEVSNSSKISEKMRALITDLKPGQKIVFKDIKAIGPDGRIRDMNPIILKIE